MGEQGKQEQGEQVTISKADYDKIVNEHKSYGDENSKLKADLEDIRMEVLTPEYAAFLQGGAKPREEAKEKPAELTDDAIEKMSKKELLELATKNAREAIMKEAPDRFKQELANQEKERVAKEIVQFSRTHEDFETFRPIMYGLSLDPKNADFTLQELYTAAKEHVTRIHTGTSEAEKEKSRKAGNEKPGGSSGSFESKDMERYKSQTIVQTGKETLDELKETLGPIPSA